VTFACALFAAAPVAATAQGYGAPVTIDTCAPMLQPNAVPSNPPSFMGVPVAAMTSHSTGMHIAFVNNGPKVAKVVNFEVSSNGNQFIVRDVGTFSPGILIDHQFNNGAGQSFFLPAFISPKVTCHVASVEFADGSVWRHGQPPGISPETYGSAAHGQLSATPKMVALDVQSEAGLFLVQTSSRVAGLRETDNCSGIASVFVGASGDNAATYYVKPLGRGTCAAHIIDEYGATVTVPIAVR